MVSSQPGSSVPGVLQAKELEQVAISFSRGSSWPRDQTCIGRQVFFFFFFYHWATWETPVASVAAKSLQSCPTLCDPIDGSPPGSSVPGTLQARILKWVAISFSNAWKWKVKVKSFSRSRLLATPWTAAYQAPPSMGFSRQEYWSGVPLPSPSSLSSSVQKQVDISPLLRSPPLLVPIMVQNVIYSKVLVAHSCPTLCDRMDCSLPGSSVHGILQARILEWVAIPFLQGILPTQGLNLGLLYCRWILYHLSHQWTSEWPVRPTNKLCCLFLFTFSLHFLHFSLAGFIPATQAFFWSSHTAAALLLQGFAVLFLLPGVLFPQMSKWLHSKPPSPFSLKVISVRPVLITLLCSFPCFNFFK